MSDLTETPFLLPDSECDQLTAALREVERLDGKLAEIASLKETSQSAAADWIDGRTTLATAAFLATLGTTDRNEVRTALLGSVKRRQHGVLQSVAPIARRIRKARADKLRDQAARLENHEREAIYSVGVDGDDYAASPAVTQLREAYACAIAQLGAPVTRGELVELAALYAD
jgi:hypothetical protein